MNSRDDLNIAEILYDTGEVHFRYSRYLAADGKKWIRHGLFRAYRKDGSLASEGTYGDGQEQGCWRDFHENEHLAAEGHYVDGKENGRWRYWDSDGTLEKEVVYFNGVETEQTR